MKIKPKSLSGFADYSEAQNVALSKWIRIIEDSFRLYGFSRLIPRPLEYRDVLLCKGGIQKQIFGVERLSPHTSTDMALPFDRTVPLAYWIAKHAYEIMFPYKRYDISYSFRGERAQAGRFQGFFQADIDIIGKRELGLNADTECIMVVFRTVKKLEIGEAYLCLNHISLVKSILFSIGIGSEEIRDVLNIIDDIPKNPIEVIKEKFASIKNISSSQSEKLQHCFAYKGRIENYLEFINCERTAEITEAFTELLNVVNFLEKGGIKSNEIIFRPCIVRGLDYYTGIVFETFIKDKEGMGSVASGGRYDDLASTFTNEKLPGVGGSIGLTRLFDIACKNELVKLSVCTEADIFVGFRVENLSIYANDFANKLRSVNVNADLYSGMGNISKQLEYASRKGFQLGVLIMEPNVVILKDLLKHTQLEFDSIDKAFQAALSHFTLPKNTAHGNKTC